MSEDKFPELSEATKIELRALLAEAEARIATLSRKRDRLARRRKLLDRVIDGYRAQLELADTDFIAEIDAANPTPSPPPKPGTPPRT